MKLFFVGGFLGSGKTTAIKAATDLLCFEGRKKVAVITNDQGKLLVDTRYIQRHIFPVQEVSNGCFCCRYHDMENKIRNLEDSDQPDIIFLESVGSCADLVSTVIHPLLQSYNGAIEIILSVFCDVRLLSTYLESGKLVFNENINYIFKKQLEEADVIVINKVDLLNEQELARVKKLTHREFDGKSILFQNSLNPNNIENWIHNCEVDALLRQSPEIDYSIYGAGEADLAWLDGEIGIVCTERNAVSAGCKLISTIYNSVLRDGFPIGHLKFLIDDGNQTRKISYTSIFQEADPKPLLDFEAERIILIINARIQAADYQLRGIISNAVLEVEESMRCKIIVSELDAFHPGFPQPTYRMHQAT
ncbi:MAG TPA: GTP-binding protein [Flavitalea sp.]|nr:GTP-binding protein [Flavitalea sp.]